MGWGGGNLGIFCQNIWRDMEGGGGIFSQQYMLPNQVWVFE